MNPNLKWNSFSRWQSLATVAALLLAGVMTSLAQTNQTEELQPAPRRASIILIMADDLGYGDLGSYGQKNIKTPNLDKLAAEGMRFTSFYGSDSGAHARASLLSGRNAAHLSDSGLLPSEGVTIGEMLKNAGYRTGFLGQWGLGGRPEDKGFEQVAATLDEADEFDHYPVNLWRYDNIGVTAPTATFMEFPDNQNGLRGTYFPDLFTKAGLNFIANNKPEAYNKYRSFFLMLSYNVPHGKLDLDDAYEYADRRWSKAERTKAAMISNLDVDVGKILDQLETTGQTNNVMVIFTSGNGPATNGVDIKLQNSNGGLRGAKGDLYEGGIRVPFIVWFPSHIKPGVNNKPYTMADVLPTLAETAWTKAPKNIDGFSLWPDLYGGTQTNAHEFLYWEGYLSGARAVRMGDWKGVRPTSGEPLELFDLKTDSQEKQDVADKHPEIVGKMEDYLKTVRGAQ